MTNDQLLEKLDLWIGQFLTGIIPMDATLTEIFMKCCMVEQEADVIPKEIQDTFLFQVAEKRLRFMQMQPTMSSLAFLAFLCRSPGEVVMYITVLRRKLGPVKLNMGNIAEVFPTGFLSPAQLSRAWDAQKLGGSNLVDVVDLREPTCPT
jgi:hypothetical protein